MFVESGGLRKHREGMLRSSQRVPPHGRGGIGSDDAGIRKEAALALAGPMLSTLLDACCTGRKGGSAATR
jgi:hypothetical protein